MHIERTYPDEYFWANNASRAKLLFENSILTELLGKFFSRPSERVFNRFYQEATKKFTATVVDLKKEI